MERIEMLVEATTDALTLVVFLLSLVDIVYFHTETIWKMFVVTMCFRFGMKTYESYLFDEKGESENEEC